MSRLRLSRILQSMMMICLAAFSGCETNNVPSGTKFIVSAPKTAFYKFGPAQSFGPDFALSEGARVTMLEHSFGYSHVMTEDGTTGFVSTDDLQPAPPGPYTTSANTKTNYTIQLSRPIFDQQKSAEKHGNVLPTHDSPGLDPADNPFPQNPDSQKPAPGSH
jgi:hypothetical protein